jgi:hypothetical protein
MTKEEKIVSVTNKRYVGRWYNFTGRIFRITKFYWHSDVLMYDAISVGFPAWNNEYPHLAEMATEINRYLNVLPSPGKFRDI